MKNTYITQIGKIAENWWKFISEFNVKVAKNEQKLSRSPTKQKRSIVAGTDVFRYSNASSGPFSLLFRRFLLFCLNLQAASTSIRFFICAYLVPIEQWSACYRSIMWQNVYERACKKCISFTCVLVRTGQGVQYIDKPYYLD